MTNSLLVLREVALRLAAAVIGYFVLFSIYLFLFAASAKHLLSISTILKIAGTTLMLPFIDIVRKPLLLIHLQRAPKVDASHTLHAEIIKGIMIGIGMEVILTVLLIAAIIAFERSIKTRASIIFFYAFMPALLWLIWSQLYLLV